VISMDPKSSIAYAGRSYDFRMLGDFDKSLADIDQAIEIDPHSSSNYRSRGLIHFAKGAFADAAVDLQKSLDLKADSYTWLFVFIARSRSGASPPPMFEKGSSGDEWPLPIIDHYAGFRSEQEVESAARSPEQRCEASFYIGELRLVRNDGPGATVALKHAE